jgi:hypothetical protein
VAISQLLKVKNRHREASSDAVAIQINSEAVFLVRFAYHGLPRRPAYSGFSQ